MLLTTAADPKHLGARIGATAVRSRGGFLLGHSQCGPRDLLHNTVGLLVPELQRRGRFRTAYTGRTLRENLAG